MGNIFKTMKPFPEFHVTCIRTIQGWGAKIETRKKQKTVQLHAGHLTERDQKGELCAAICNAMLEMWRGER